MKNYISKLSAVVSEVGETNPITGIKSTLIENTIGDVAFSMIGTGQYHCISNGLFSKERTFPYVQPSDGSSSPATGQFHCHVIDANTILIYSIDQADNSVEIDFRHLSFKIENY